MFVPVSGILGGLGEARPSVPIPRRKIPETLNGGCGGSVAFLLLLIVYRSETCILHATSYKRMCCTFYTVSKVCYTRSPCSSRSREPPEASAYNLTAVGRSNSADARKLALGALGPQLRAFRRSSQRASLRFSARFSISLSL